MKTIPYVVAITTLLLVGVGCGKSTELKATDSATTTSATSTVTVPPNTLIVPNVNQPQGDEMPDGKG